MARTKLRDMKIDRVALVDKGDNPPARVVLIKRMPGAAAAARFIAKLKELRTQGVDITPEVQKATYAEVMEGRELENACRVLENRVDALSESFYSMIYFVAEPGEQRDLKAELAETISQFAEGVTGELPDILAGKIVKRFEGDAVPPDFDEFKEAVSQELAKFSEGSVKPDDQPEEDTMSKGTIQLSDLDDGQRTTLAALVARAKRADELEAQATNKDKPPIVPDVTADPYEQLAKALPETAQPIVAILKQQSDLQKAEIELLKGQVTEATAKVAAVTAGHQEAEFAKSLKFEHLAIKSEELAKVLFPLDTDARTTLVGVLSAADEAVKKTSAITKSLGVSVVPTVQPGTAAAEVEAAIVKMREIKPDMTAEQAETAVYKANPELYDRYLAEQSQQ